MGACNIEFTLNKKATMREINEAFKQRQDQDKDENGHREGYSGDFQTVDRVLDHTHKIFNSYNEAHDYCLNTADKWTNVVAVYYKSGDFKPNKKALNIRAKIKQTTDKLFEVERQSVKLPKFKTCEGCQSKISTQYLRGTKCPVCNEGDFRPLGLQFKIAKLKAKIKFLEGQFNTVIEELKTKSLQKLGDGSIKTMVAGWGAC